VQRTRGNDIEKKKKKESERDLVRRGGRTRLTWPMGCSVLCSYITSPPGQTGEETSSERMAFPERLKGEVEKGKIWGDGGGSFDLMRQNKFKVWERDRGVYWKKLVDNNQVSGVETTRDRLVNSRTKVGRAKTG